MIYWVKNLSKWKLALGLSLTGVIIAGAAVAIAVPLVLSKNSSHPGPEPSTWPNLNKIARDKISEDQSFFKSDKFSIVESEALNQVNNILKLDKSNEISTDDVYFTLFDSSKSNSFRITGFDPELKDLETRVGHQKVFDPVTGHSATGYWQLKAKPGNNKVEGETAFIPITVYPKIDFSKLTQDCFSDKLNAYLEDEKKQFDWNNKYQDLLNDFYGAIGYMFGPLFDYKADIGYDSDTTKPLTAKITVNGNEINSGDFGKYLTKTDMDNDVNFALTLTVNASGESKYYKNDLDDVNHKIEKLDLSKYDAVPSVLATRFYDIRTDANTVKTEFAKALYEREILKSDAIGFSDVYNNLDISFSSGASASGYVPGGQNIRAIFNGISNSPLIKRVVGAGVEVTLGDGDTRYNLKNIPLGALQKYLQDHDFPGDNSNDKKTIGDLKTAIADFLISSSGPLCSIGILPAILTHDIQISSSPTEEPLKPESLLSSLDNTFVIKAPNGTNLTGENSNISFTFDFADEKFQTRITNELSNYFFTWNTNLQPTSAIEDRMYGLLSDVTFIDEKTIKDDVKIDGDQGLKRNNITQSASEHYSPSKLPKSDSFFIFFQAKSNDNGKNPFSNDFTTEYTILDSGTQKKVYNNYVYVVGNDDSIRSDSKDHGAICLQAVIQQLTKSKKLVFTSGDSLETFFKETFALTIDKYAPSISKLKLTSNLRAGKKYDNKNRIIPFPESKSSVAIRWGGDPSGSDKYTLIITDFTDLGKTTMADLSKPIIYSDSNKSFECYIVSQFSDKDKETYPFPPHWLFSKYELGHDRDVHDRITFDIVKKGVKF